MLRYVLAAAALKAFSLNAATRHAYRQIGNVIGARRRSKILRAGYIERADGNLRFAEKHGAIADGMRVLELGTGWVHWESLFTRLFYDVETVLFDVWDNRQFEGFHNYAAILRERLPGLTSRSAAAREKAISRLDRVLACASFDEVYRELGWRYIVEPDGSLAAVGDSTIDLVYSSDVMEHIPEQALEGLADDLRRILKPGAHVTQQIVVADHLTIYDRAVHPKKYLAFDEGQWRRWFVNDVQYMNRWQHSDFVRLYRDKGFRVVDQETVDSADTSMLAIAPRWKSYDKSDLDACVTRLLVQAP